MPPLGTKVARAAAWSAVRIATNQVTSFVVFLCLTRLLGPRDIGLMALAAAILDLAGPLTRAGFPESLIQRSEPTAIQADTCFWTTLGLSTLMMGVVMLAAPLAGAAFDSPALVSLLRVSAVILPLAALGSTHEARLTREFGHKALAVRGIAANLAGGVLGIAMALTGWGVWSLVAQRVAAMAAGVVFAWSAYRWLPRLRFSWAEFSKMGRFGIHMVSLSSLAVLNARMVDFVIGYFAGAATVGHVRVASRCVDMVTQFTMAPFSSVTLPALSRLQGDPVAFDRGYRRMVRACALVTFPAYLGLAAVADDIVPLLFGSQWSLSVPIVRVLCLGVIPLTLHAFTWTAITAVGRSDRAALGALINVISSAATVGLVAPFGAVLAIGANVVRAHFGLLIGLRFLRKYTGVRAWPLLRSAVLPLLSAIVMVACIVAVKAVTGEVPRAARAGITIAIGAAVYAILLWTTGKDVVLEMREIWRRSGPKGSGGESPQTTG